MKRFFYNSKFTKLTALFWLFPLLLHASTFEDKVADVVSWVALIVAPIIMITVFLMIHVLPEKIAEKRNHPQAQAIKTLCILSLFFGGILWPLAWLWTYSKPVFYKMAYGTDKGDYHEETFDDLKKEKDQDKS
ncbi:DUF3302 domain-containing protein [Echinicola sp. CAU 1574]|uniref:DUF3302 domain-containing protein n=1 Tax=Echinicola arenosa TaxID=2774144 RepID=A0ABR9APR4_9BACT|nr:DUF3302 domain-containing protein [Echinicola arenosa]MBD8490777.1 DUF3302 domain-containing protein [Echinicola arenosa]